MPLTNPFWIAFGDIHGNLKNFSQIKELADAKGVIITGDITNAGRTNDADKLLKKIKSVNPNIYAQIGNMDYPEIITYLEQEGCNIHAKVVKLNSRTGLMGLGYSNPTPFSGPSEVDDTTLAKWLDTTYKNLIDVKHLILATHTPPFGCQSDRLNNGQHVGSTAVKNFVQQYQPDVCITGHIHEAIAEEWLGRTKVINPGMLSAGGYVTIEQNQNGLEANLSFVESCSSIQE